MSSDRWFAIAVAIVITFFSTLVVAADPIPLKVGEPVTLKGDQTATLVKLDDLPFVENDFSKRYKYDTFDNPKLKTLAEQFKLREVIAPGKDEFDQQVLLLDWAHHQLKKFGRPDSEAKGALEILKANDEGHTFFCAHYADVLVSAAASLGWVDRSLALRRADSMGTGSTEHSSTEIWSNQYRKWVMLDPTFAMYAEKDGIPLSAYELRQEWFYGDGKALTFVVGKERKRYHKSDMPVFRARFAGFGDLNLDPSGVNVYAFIGYVPNTNLMNDGPDYGKMFITRDKLCDGTQWHERIAPPDPAKDPYFPIGQAAMTIAVDDEDVVVHLKTMTPNFKGFLKRHEYAAGKFRWDASRESFGMMLHPGINRVEVRTVNQFGVEGPISTAEVEMKVSKDAPAPR